MFHEKVAHFLTYPKKTTLASANKATRSVAIVNRRLN